MLISFPTPQKQKQIGVALDRFINILTKNIP